MSDTDRIVRAFLKVNFIYEKYCAKEGVESLHFRMSLGPGRGTLESCWSIHRLALHVHACRFPSIDNLLSQTVW